MIKLLATRTMSLQVIPASPIQCLSSDILWRIFQYAFVSDPLRGSINVSQVSRWWRHLALDSPFIWSEITIRLNLSSATSPSKHLLASAYFERSKNFPISLYICATRLFSPKEKTELILRHSHRFRSVHVTANDDYLANQLWMEMDIPMPNLETFDTVVSSVSLIQVSTRNATTSTIDEKVSIIPPVHDDTLVYWNLWYPIGLTTLTLNATGLWSPPFLDEIYHVLATTCHTLQIFQYQGPIAGIQVDNAEVITWSRLEFPELRSLTIFCHDNMVPLLQFMPVTIPTLESLILRDFVMYPATIPTTFENMDIDDPDLTFDRDGFFQVIEQWTTIHHLEIHGIDGSNLASDDLSKLSSYIKSLNQLSSLILYGTGLATSVAYSIFSMQSDSNQPGGPPLPRLSSFLVAIIEMSASHDHLSDFLNSRQRHNLPRLQNLSINSDYLQYLRGPNQIDISCLWESSDNIFVVPNPEISKYIPPNVERLPRHT